MYGLDGTLSGLHPPGISDERHNIVYHPLHSFFSHAITQGREALGSRCPDEREARLES